LDGRVNKGEIRISRARKGMIIKEPVCPSVPLRAAKRKRRRAVHWLTIILKL
jgi:hypothetical protein